MPNAYARKIAHFPRTTLFLIQKNSLGELGASRFYAKQLAPYLALVK